MSDMDYFEGFDETQNEEEVQQRWGDSAMYLQSQRKWSSYTEAQKQAIKVEGGRLMECMVTSDPNASPDDPGVQAAVGDYFAYLNKYFYNCDLDHLRGLAEMWVQDPRFARNYESIREGGAAFVHEAVHIYSDSNG